MEKFPKRRKSKDNPYNLCFDEKTNTYKIKFIDSLSKQQEVEIDYELYLIFNQFELKDLSMMNEYDRHIEHIEQSDEMLYHNAINKSINIEDKVIEKIMYQELKKEIERLPDIQKRRLKMYFFKDMTLREIAVIEGCSIRSIKYSIDIAISKLLKNFKF